MVAPSQNENEFNSDRENGHLVAEWTMKTGHLHWQDKTGNAHLVAQWEKKHLHRHGKTGNGHLVAQWKPWKTSFRVELWEN